MPDNIILFDGICNLCNTSVKFIISHDPGIYFRFASLQSDIGKEILKRFISKSDPAESIILFENNQVFFKSTAVLRIARKLDGLWPMFYALIIIPSPIRDFVYDIVAKYRYRIFGRQKECMIPGPEISSRFPESFDLL